MYDLKSLMIKFAEDAIQYEKQQVKLKEEFIENNPGKRLPVHLKDDFCLPKALLSICREIQKLKNDV